MNSSGKDGKSEPPRYEDPHDGSGNAKGAPAPAMRKRKTHKRRFHAGVAFYGMETSIQPQKRQPSSASGSKIDTGFGWPMAWLATP